MNDYEAGQIELIKYLQSEVQQFVDEGTTGIDLMLDIANLILKLQPLEKND